MRGGIIDLYPAGLPNPVRLDFFGDTLESIRSFDPETQRTVGQLRALDLVPMSEVQLTTETIRRFRQAYVAAFGAPTRDDRLYEAVSEGRRYPGMEHWLPLFHDRLDTLLDYVPEVPVVFDALADDAAAERLAQVKDYYDARRAAMDQPQPGVAPYRPLPPDALYWAPTNGPSARRRSRSRGSPPSRFPIRMATPSWIARRGADATSSPSGRTRAPTYSRRRSATSAPCRARASG